MTKKTIYLGADHGGFELKEKVKVLLEEQGYNIEDLGAHSLVLEDDYPDYAVAVANKVINKASVVESSFDGGTGGVSVGILVCRSGGGMVVAANKVKGIRAVSVHNKESAVHAKEHNDANIISISADWTTESQVKEIILAYLETNFSGEERHVRRINKIKEFENTL